ncbi:MAG: hypothetical protein LBQ12_10560, partial [Deltaproteobacteria bacterium]|nr:hypothetical protein [Deltaproteobacteria bacterium]
MGLLALRNCGLRLRRLRRGRSPSKPGLRLLALRDCGLRPRGLGGRRLDLHGLGSRGLGLLAL